MLKSIIDRFLTVTILLIKNDKFGNKYDVILNHTFIS